MASASAGNIPPGNNPPADPEQNVTYAFGQVQEVERQLKDLNDLKDAFSYQRTVTMVGQRCDALIGFNFAECQQFNEYYNNRRAVLKTGFMDSCKLPPTAFRLNLVREQLRDLEWEKLVFDASFQSHPLVARAHHYDIVRYYGQQRHPGDISTMNCILSPDKPGHNSVDGCKMAINDIVTSGQLRHYVGLGFTRLVPRSEYDKWTETAYPYVTASDEFRASANLILGNGEPIPVYGNQRELHNILGTRDEYLKMMGPNPEQYHSSFAQTICVSNLAGKHAIFDLGRSQAPRLALLELFNDPSITKVMPDYSAFRGIMHQTFLSRSNQYTDASVFGIREHLFHRCRPNVAGFSNQPSFLSVYVDCLRMPGKRPAGSVLEQGAYTYFHANGYQIYNGRSILAHSHYFGEPNDQGVLIHTQDGPAYDIARMNALMSLDLALAYHVTNRGSLITSPDAFSVKSMRLAAYDFTIPNTVIGCAQEGHVLPPPGWICKYGVPCMLPFFNRPLTNEQFDSKLAIHNQQVAELTSRLEECRFLYQLACRDRDHQKKRHPSRPNQGTPSSRTGPYQQRQRSHSRNRARSPSGNRTEQRPAPTPQVSTTVASAGPLTSILKQSQKVPLPADNEEPMPLAASAQVAGTSGTSTVPKPRKIGTSDPIPTDPKEYEEYVALKRSLFPPIFEQRGFLTQQDLALLLPVDWTRYTYLSDLLHEFPTEGDVLSRLVPVPLLDIKLESYHDYLVTGSVLAKILWNWKMEFRTAFKAVCLSRPFACCTALFTALACEALRYAYDSVTLMSVHPDFINDPAELASFFVEFYLFVARSSFVPTFEEHCALRGENQDTPRLNTRSVIADVVFSSDSSRLLIRNYGGWIRQRSFPPYPLDPTTEHLGRFWTLYVDDLFLRTLVPFSHAATPRPLLDDYSAETFSRDDMFNDYHTDDELIGGYYLLPPFARNIFTQAADPPSEGQMTIITDFNCYTAAFHPPQGAGALSAASSRAPSMRSLENEYVSRSESRLDAGEESISSPQASMDVDDQNNDHQIVETPTGTAVVTQISSIETSGLIPVSTVTDVNIFDRHSTTTVSDAASGQVLFHQSEFLAPASSASASAWTTVDPAQNQEKEEGKMEEDDQENEDLEEHEEENDKQQQQQQSPLKRASDESNDSADVSQNKKASQEASASSGKKSNKKKKTKKPAVAAKKETTSQRRSRSGNQ